ELINNIRKDDDNLEQEWKEEKGLVRVYIVPNNLNSEQQTIENLIEKRMASELETEQMNFQEFDRLILEHHMASNRYGFNHFFLPLNTVQDYKEGIRDGTLKELKFLKDIVLGLF